MHTLTLVGCAPVPLAEAPAGELLPGGRFISTRSYIQWPLGLAGAPSRELKSGANVFRFQIRIQPQNLFVGMSGGNHTHDHSDCYAQTADAGLAAHHFGVPRYAIERGHLCQHASMEAHTQVLRPHERFEIVSATETLQQPAATGNPLATIWIARLSTEGQISASCPNSCHSPAAPTISSATTD